MTCLVNQHILRLDVAMDDTIPLAFFDRQNQLGQVDPCVLLWQSARRLLIDHVSHIARGTIICHHVEVLEGLEGIVQLGDKLMIDLTLNLLIGDHEPSQPIVSTFFHSLHCIELASACSSV